METGTAHDDKLWRSIADQGWTRGCSSLKRHGGLVATFGSGRIRPSSRREMGRACLPGAFLSTLTAAALCRAARETRAASKYVEPIAAGSCKATVAFLRGGRETGEVDGDQKLKEHARGVVTSAFGRKLFVPDAGIADLLICVARDEGDFALLPVESVVRKESQSRSDAFDGRKDAQAPRGHF